jgi:hypothetical protein
MVGLTNIEVENLGKQLLGNLFVGVYPADSAPKNKSMINKSVIFNLSKHTEPGSHYIAVLFLRNKILYFDSYGKSLKNKYIRKTLKKFNLPIFYHTQSIQDPNSIYCSLFALAYLKAIQKNKMTPNNFYKMFNKPPNKENDKIVTKFLLTK